MPRRILPIIALLVLVLMGCVPIDALNPFYTDNNVIFDPALLGKWQGNEPNEFYRFDRGENNAYQFVYVKTKESEIQQEAVFEAHLINLGGEKYLDMVCREIKGSPQQAVFQMDSSRKGARFTPTLERVGTGMYLEILGPTPGKGTMQELQVKFRPAHWILKVEQHEKSMTLYFLDDEWIRKGIEKKTIRAGRVKARDENQMSWVLTGSTADLQQLVVHTADEPGAFVSGMALRKIE